jgi:Mce-associated membrane protein
VQDQPDDSSDLNTDEDAAVVPEGKAARRRHRMPRQKLRQGTVDEADAESASPADEVEAEPEAEPEAAVEAETPADPEPEPAAEPEADDEAAAEATESADKPEPEPEVPNPEPATRRSRFPWRRAEAVVPAPTAAEPEPEAEVAVAEPSPDTAEVIKLAESDSATAESEGSAEQSDEADQADDSSESESEPPAWILVPHRPAGRRLKIAAIVAGAFFVAASAFAGATLQPYLVDRAGVQTKIDVARTAQAAITTLWTYTPEDMDKLDDRAAKYLGGDFAKDYKDYITRIVEANKQAQISNSTQVLGAAVESLTPTEATAIIYTNSVATSPVTKGIPSLRYLSYRLQLEREGGRWLITTMTAVTSLDLTPRL